MFFPKNPMGIQRKGEEQKDNDKAENREEQGPERGQFLRKEPVLDKNGDESNEAEEEDQPERKDRFDQELLQLHKYFRLLMKGW